MRRYYSDVPKFLAFETPHDGLFLVFGVPNVKYLAFGTPNENALLVTMAIHIGGSWLLVWVWVRVNVVLC